MQIAFQFFEKPITLKNI